MNPITTSYLASFWSAPVVEANLLVFLNLAGALALGLVQAYSHSRHTASATASRPRLVDSAFSARSSFAGNASKGTPSPMSG